MNYFLYFYFHTWLLDLKMWIDPIFFPSSQGIFLSRLSLFYSFCIYRNISHHFILVGLFFLPVFFSSFLSFFHFSQSYNILNIIQQGNNIINIVDHYFF